MNLYGYIGAKLALLDVLHNVWTKLKSETYEQQKPPKIMPELVTPRRRLPRGAAGRTLALHRKEMEAKFWPLAALQDQTLPP